MQGIPMFNIVYADKDGNIFFISNGLFPKRPEGNINWDAHPLQGNTSATYWEEAYSTQELPQANNPDCGYVFNMNNTPFNATCAEENDDAARLPSTVDARPGDNNRSERFMELIAAKETFSYTDFKAIKFDENYPETCHFLRTIQPLFDLDEQKYPEIKETITRLKNWDKNGAMSNTGATIFALTVDHIFKKKGISDASFVLGVQDLEESLCVEAVTYAQTFLLKHHGSLDVPYSAINRFYKDGKDYPSAGFPDMLNVSYSRPHDGGGKFKLKYGDTYIHFVNFSKEGPAKIETLLPYNFTEEGAPQLELYNKKELKEMSLDKEVILKKAKRVYSPVK